MPEKIINTRIQVLNDTAEALAAQGTAIPKAGEIVYENDTRKMKIGDGTTSYANLKYFGGDSAKHFDVVAEANEEDVTAILRVVGSAEVHTGDTAIVKRVITGDKISHTAYVYNGTNWAACDGNYRADNVYFDDDITYTVAIGTLAKPSGSAKFDAKGKSVEQVLSKLMAQEQNPSKTNPAVSFSAQGGFGTFEIGTKKNLTYTAALSAGSYTYGPATGITAQSWSVSCTGVTGTKTTATGTFENVVAESNGKKIVATAQYGDGAIPVTNLGNPYPTGKIAAGSATANSNEFKGVRYMFWGPMTTDAAINSAAVRALAHNKATATGNLATFGAGAGAKKVIVAIPSDRKITKVIMPSALNADVTALFVKQSTTVPVEGANGYTAAAYNIYVYQPASIDAGETYTVTIG
nr:MAG TPA: hyaluronidase [Caudoviricetes sp.]